MKLITNKIAQAKYQSEIDGKYALRTSLWRYENDEWMMFFHQGTPIENDGDNR